jgi:hypothetical protein
MSIINLQQKIEVKNKLQIAIKWRIQLLFQILKNLQNKLLVAILFSH